MARSVSRKSTKKCGPRKHGRKAHMRKGKMVKSVCVKNRKRTMKRTLKSKAVKQRGFWSNLKNRFFGKKQPAEQPAQAQSEGVAMSALKIRKGSSKVASRKSTKKCGPRKHGRKAHMRKGKMVKSVCVKNRKRTMKRTLKSKAVKQRGFWSNLKNRFFGKKQPAEQPAQAQSEGVAMSALKSKSRSRKSGSKSASRKSGSKSGSRKRVLGTGACTSRKMSECTKDSRCQIRRRPKGGKTCVLGKGWKQVHNEAERLAMIGAY